MSRGASRSWRPHVRDDGTLGPDGPRRGTNKVRAENQDRTELNERIPKLSRQRDWKVWHHTITVHYGMLLTLRQLFDALK
jgi:hypothetical protein